MGMGKLEFLDKLRLALNGRVGAGTLSDTLTYYEDYISAEMRKGRSEEEVMASLGDPRLIARTIMETEDREEQSVSEEYGEDAKVKRFHSAVPGWVVLAGVVVAAVIILGIVFRILKALFPFILMLFVISFVVKFFRDRTD